MAKAKPQLQSPSSAPSISGLVVNRGSQAMTMTGTAERYFGVTPSLQGLNFETARAMRVKTHNQKALAQLTQRYERDFKAYIDACVKLEQMQSNITAHTAEAVSQVSTLKRQLEEKLAPILSQVSLDGQRTGQAVAEAQSNYDQMSNYYRQNHDSRMRSITKRVNRMVNGIRSSERLNDAFDWIEAADHDVVAALGGANGSQPFAPNLGAGQGEAITVPAVPVRRSPGLNPLKWANA